MKRIQSACIYKTIHFQLKDGLEHEAAVAAVRQEAAAYEAGFWRSIPSPMAPFGSKLKCSTTSTPWGSTWIEPPHATPEGPSGSSG